MTDEPDVTAEDSPEADAVRRLLADARYDDPMPADVAARMDNVLADLADSPPAGDRADERTTATVVTRLPGRRRWQGAALLGAAAAIVIGGVVVAQHPPHTAQVSGSAASGAEGNDRFEPGNTGNSQAQPPASPPQAADGTTKASRLVVRNGRVVVRPQSFAADALAGRKLLGPDQLSQSFTLAPAGCRTGSDAGQAVPALYNNAPAELVYHHVNGSTQVVDLVVCGTTSAVRTVTLPAR